MVHTVTPRRGFSLLELLIVVGIVGVLTGLLLAGVQKVRTAAARTACQNNLRQIALGCQNFHAAKGALPVGAAPPAQASALVHLLPYVEQAERYRKFDLAKNVNDPTQSDAQVGDIAMYLCPADPNPGGYGPKKGRGGPPYIGRSNYLAAHGGSAAFHDADPATAGLFGYEDGPTDLGVKLTEVADGTSNTALYAEVKRNAPFDAAPNPLDVTYLALEAEWADDRAPFPACDAVGDHKAFKYTGCEFYRGFYLAGLYTHTATPNYPGRDCVHTNVDQKTGLDRGHQAARSYHPGGVNAALADGSVRFVPTTIDPGVWRALGTRAAGDTAAAGGG